MLRLYMHIYINNVLHTLYLYVYMYIYIHTYIYILCYSDPAKVT